MSEMRKLTRYFGLLDGTPKPWDAAAERVFDDLFHPNVQLVGKQQTLNFDQWKAWYRTSIEDGLQVDMEHLQVLSATSIQWKISIHHATNGTKFSHTARGIFDHGQLIRTLPLDPAVYDLMTQQHALQQKRKPVCIL